jgi:hypothetical protein
VRDLCRARDDAREDLQRGRHRLGKLLLRRGLCTAVARSLDAGASEMAAQFGVRQRVGSRVLSDYLLAIEQVEQRIQTLSSS